MGNEVIKILEQFRDRQGNSNDDIKALDAAIKSVMRKITISQLSDLIAYEVYNLVTYIRVYEVDRCYTTCVIIHNETELCIFTDIFGDAEIDAVEGDINCVIGNIHFNDLNTVELLKKVDEYNHKVYL